MKFLKVRYKEGSHQSKEFLIHLSDVCYFASSKDGITELQAVKLAVAFHLQKTAWVIGYSDTERFTEDGKFYDVSKDMFSVNEHATGFSVTHRDTDKTHWLSDGVDVLTMCLDDTEVTLRPGTLGFVETWEDSLNSNVGETLEAYFPDLVEE